MNSSHYAVTGSCEGVYSPRPVPPHSGFCRAHAPIVAFFSLEDNGKGSGPCAQSLGNWRGDGPRTALHVCSAVQGHMSPGQPQQSHTGQKRALLLISSEDQPLCLA